MLEYIKEAIKFVYDRRTRVRILGFRPTVICLIQCVEDEGKFLFIRPTGKPTAWMPPQEGVDPKESIEQAVERGLNAELGVSENQLQFRRSVWMGCRSIPEQRGERDVEHSPLGMRGKAYYAALVKLSNATEIQVNPAEIAECEWVEVTDIVGRLPANSERKQELIRTMFSKLLKTEIDDDSSSQNS